MYAGQFSSRTPSASQRTRKLTASWSTRASSLKSKTTRRPLASELNCVFNSARFSAPNRPLTVNTTSSFSTLVILSICPLSKTPTCAAPRDAICSCCGNHNSKGKLLKMDEIPACGMSETSAIAEIPYSMLVLSLHCIPTGCSLLSLLRLDGGAPMRQSVQCLRTDHSSSFPTSSLRLLLAAKLREAYNSLRGWLPPCKLLSQPGHDGIHSAEKVFRKSSRNR
jgi:hypothetical protein